MTENITTPADTASIVGHRIPASVAGLLIPTPPTEGPGGPMRAAVRLTGTDFRERTEQIGVVQHLSHSMGVRGRMWNSIDGAEGDFAVVNPEPVDGRTYLALAQNQTAFAYLERRDGLWVYFGRMEESGGSWPFLPSPLPTSGGIDPTFWVEVKDPRVDPPQGHTPPEAVPAVPHWAKFVKPSPPTRTYSTRLAFIVSSPDPAHAHLAGQFRYIASGPVDYQGKSYDMDVDTSAPVVASLMNTRQTSGTYHLSWPSRNSAITGDDPVIVHLSGFTFTKVADSHGNPVDHEPIGSAFTLPSVWSPPVGEPLDTATVTSIQQEFTHLWERWSEAMNEAADNHDWCPEYEKAVHPLGFPGRADRKRDWQVTVHVYADVSFTENSGRVDAALTREFGVDVVASEVTASVSLTVSETLEGMTRQEALDYVDSSTVEEWLNSSNSGSWDVTDYSIEEIEEA